MTQPIPQNRNPSWIARAARALAGEGAVSAFHFGLNLTLLRVLPAHEYGLFAIVFTLGSLAFSYIQAAMSLPVSVMLPRWRSPAAAHAQDLTLGSAATAASGFCGILGLLGFLAATGEPALALAAGCFLALWPLRGYARTALFARGRVAEAARSDVTTALTGALAVLPVLLLSPREALTASVAGLALANAVGLVAALRAVPGRVRVSFKRSVRRRYLGIGRQVSWSLASVTTANIQAQALALGTAALLGPAAYAPIAAALVLFSPLRLVATALVAFSQPDFARSLHEGAPEKARAALFRASGLLALCLAAYGGALWLGFGLLRLLFRGSAFDIPEAGQLTLLAGFASGAYLATLLPKAMMEAQGGFGAVAGVTLIAALLCVLTVPPLIFYEGAEAGLAAMMASEFVALVLFWRGALSASGRRSGPLLKES